MEGGYGSTIHEDCAIVYHQAIKDHQGFPSLDYRKPKSYRNIYRCHVTHSQQTTDKQKKI